MEPRRPRGKASSHRAEKVLSASAKKAAGAEARAATPREGKAKDGGKGGGARAMPGWMFSQRVAQPDLALLNASLRLPETDLSLERLFVSRPRVLPFSHRPLFSIRHPFVRHAVLDRTGCSPRAKKPPRQRSNSRESCLSLSQPSAHPQSLLNHLKLKNGPAVLQEEKKWVELAHLFDAIAVEDEITACRLEVLNSSVFVTAVDNLWGLFVGNLSDGMTQAAHREVSFAAWKHFVGPHVDRRSDFFNIVMRGLAADWSTDAADKETISYGTFTLSIMELVDNWIDTVSPQQHAEAVDEIAAEAAEGLLRSGEGRARAGVVTELNDGTTWPQKKAFIARNYGANHFSMLNSLMSKVRRREGTGAPEYYMGPRPLSSPTAYFGGEFEAAADEEERQESEESADNDSQQTPGDQSD